MRTLIGFLILGYTLLRVGLASTLGAGNDEAYYAQYLAHPSLSYFDQPPMIAVVAAFGRLLTGSPSIFGLRLGFILLFAATSWIVSRLGGRLYGPSAVLPAFIFLQGSLYLSVAVGTFVLPDGPLLFWWFLTLERLAGALHIGQNDREQAPSLARWLLVGLAWGGALLSKYHAIFLPLGFVLFGIRDRRARAELRRPGPYLAVLLGLAIFSPVIFWNATHEWSSFRFQGGRAVDHLSIRIGPALINLLAEAAYLTPWIALILIQTMIRTISNWSKSFDQRARADWFLGAFGIVPFVFFNLLALVQPVFPHWGLIGLATLIPAAAGRWALDSRWQPERSRRRLMIIGFAPIIVASLLVIQAETGLISALGSKKSSPTGSQADLTRDLFGWDQIVDELHEHGLLDQPQTFLFSGHWWVSGQLAQAVGPQVPVLCYHEGDSRGFGDWSDPAQWVGQDGILISVDQRSTEPACFERWFERIETISEFEIIRNDRPIRSVRIFRCVNQLEAFPY